MASAWTVIVIVLCLIPGSWLNEQSPVSLPWYVPQADKAVHFGMFFFFGWLWAGVGNSGKLGWRVLACGLLLAAGTELAQGLPLIDRDPDVVDALADSLGTVAGIGVYLRSRRWGLPKKSSTAPID